MLFAILLRLVNINATSLELIGLPMLHSRVGNASDRWHHLWLIGYDSKSLILIYFLAYLRVFTVNTSLQSIESSEKSDNEVVVKHEMLQSSCFHDIGSVPSIFNEIACENHSTILQFRRNFNFSKQLPCAHLILVDNQKIYQHLLLNWLHKILKSGSNKKFGFATSTFLLRLNKKRDNTRREKNFAFGCSLVV